jgi:biotin carboxyl carrier protein
VHGLGVFGAAAGDTARPSAPVAEARAHHAAGAEQVRAPMQGTIVKAAVDQGDAVKAGDLLVVLEAMKMENHINAPRDGTVTSVAVKAGQNVETGATLVVLE